MPNFTGVSQVALPVKNPSANAGDVRDVGLISGSENEISRQGNIFHTKNKIELQKKRKKTTNETEINNLPDKECKAIVRKMLTELRKE